jgi:sulfur-oxidizing protein SoxY
MNHALTRRSLLRAAGVAAVSVTAGRAAAEEDAEQAFVATKFGRAPTLSERVRLQMPPRFANGYTVPLALEVDCAMSDADHPRAVHVIAPLNPIQPVATYRFTPASGRARISTRIRLAKPQYVIAVADMSDGSLLMAKTWVVVETDGCA